MNCCTLQNHHKNNDDDLLAFFFFPAAFLAISWTICIYGWEKLCYYMWLPSSWRLLWSAAFMHEMAEEQEKFPFLGWWHNQQPTDQYDFSSQSIRWHTYWQIWLAQSHWMDDEDLWIWPTWASSEKKSHAWRVTHIQRVKTYLTMMMLPLIDCNASTSR